MPLLLLLDMLILSSMGSGTSVLRVDCDVVRLPSGFFNGPRWVSLNSIERVSVAQDIIKQEKGHTLRQIPGHFGKVCLGTWMIRIGGMLGGCRAE